MTTEEVYREYINRFILIIEAAGEETNNSSYMNVEKVLSENETIIDQLIQDDAPFDVFVSALIVVLLVDIHDLDTLSDLDQEEVTKLAESMYVLYLKRPTKKFAAKYGIPLDDGFNCSVDVRKISK